MSSNSELQLQVERPSESVSEMIVRKVQEAIGEGVLAPGRRLTERELVDLTGVSRTSVREAVRHLQTLGLVEPSPSRGVRVARLGSDEVREIYEVRDALEPAATELFVLRAADAEVAAIVEKVSELVEDPKPDVGSDGRASSVFQFDEMLIDGARNSLLKSTLAPLHARVHALRKLSITVPGRWSASAQEYLELAEAIKARDPVRAAEMSHRHVRGAAEAALAAVRQLETN